MSHKQEIFLSNIKSEPDTNIIVDIKVENNFNYSKINFKYNEGNVKPENEAENLFDIKQEEIHIKDEIPDQNINDYKPLANQKASHSGDFSSNYKAPAENLFMCSTCEFKTPLESNLKRHMRRHTNEKPFVLNISELKTAQKNDFKYHMKARTVEKYSCNLCEFTTIRKRNLINHAKTHTEEKPFVCTLCSKYKSLKKSDLERHIRGIHTGEKPFMCNVCEYKASAKNNLITHMKIHTAEKPFACNLCEYKAVQKHCLKIHMRCHTGEKPFACNFCKFKTVRKHYLTMHMRIHTGEKPFACNICEYRATRKDHLICHIKKVHTTAK